jgi:hypothetical protein
MASKSGGGGGSGSSSGGEGQRITWDEETIAEHDKLRGTRSKIVEADTPYIVYDEDGDTAVEKRAAAPGTSGLAGSADALALAKRSEKAWALPPAGAGGAESLGGGGGKSSNGGNHDNRSSRGYRGTGGGGDARGALDMDLLARKLEAHAAATAAGGEEVPTFASSFAADVNMTDSPNPRKQKDRKAFLNKRKNHYNEFKMAKLLAAQIMDEEDEEGEEGGGGTRSSRK